MENISIILHIPERQPIGVIVNSHETSQMLEQYVENDRPHTFFFKDIPICPAFTFKWFGIADGADIYVRFGSFESNFNDYPNYKRSNSSHLEPINQYNTTIKNGKKTKRKQIKKSFESPSRISSIAEINQENARIKDQFVRKIEGTVVCYRKIMKRFTHMSQNEPVRQYYQEPTVISNSPPMHPSTEELPRIWTEEEDENVNYSAIQSPISPP